MSFELIDLLCSMQMRWSDTERTTTCREEDHRLLIFDSRMNNFVYSIKSVTRFHSYR